MGNRPSTDGPIKEGVIKFRCEWNEAPLDLALEGFEPLLRWRRKLKERGLVGVFPDGIGFGNLSIRSSGGAFLITGSGTGGLEALELSDLSLVTDYDLEMNSLYCQGETVASSESLSHAAVYRARPEVGCVIHIHSGALWAQFLHRLPTTDPAFEYGTVEMALALADLARTLDVEEVPTLVMGGHQDGLITFGPDLERVGEEVLRLAGSSSHRPGGVGSDL